MCCTTGDDVHPVTAVGDEPTIGIHVYGGNIGTTKRRSYDPATGSVEWFDSGRDNPRVWAATRAGIWQRTAADRRLPRGRRPSGGSVWVRMHY